MTAPLDPPVRARVIELRQYTLVPGRRDELIDLFDTELVSAQEDAGMHVIGQFYDLDDPDRFVWLRGFDSMPARAAALRAFYYGPVWTRHRDAANATMIDSDNVLLLHPVSLGASYPRFGKRALANPADGFICADIVLTASLARSASTHAALTNELEQAGADVVGIFETATSANNFPQLPIRDDTAIVALTRFATSAELAEFTARTAVGTPHHSEVRQGLRATGFERRRLRPTAQSQLR